MAPKIQVRKVWRLHDNQWVWMVTYPNRQFPAYFMRWEPALRYAVHFAEMFRAGLVCKKDA